MSERRDRIYIYSESTRALEVYVDIRYVDGNNLPQVITKKKADLTAGELVIALDTAKKSRHEEIDEKTSDLINGGFVHSSKNFSLTEQAQINMLGTGYALDKGWMVYPLTFSTDDGGTHNIVDSAEWGVFFTTALGAVKTYYNGGQALKANVTAAVDIAGVLAIIDNR
jgi:hypothetical protein